MSSPTSATEAILSQVQRTAKAYAEETPGAREQLLSLSQALTASLELPSEAIQRMGWAEVSLFGPNLALKLISTNDRSLLELHIAAWRLN